jgi:AcrR family transcriptional regulator
LDCKRRISDNKGNLSGMGAPLIAHRKIDRRIERTRALLLNAFRDLVLEAGYARIKVGDIVDRANVGRSTFYEHFENKSDILQQSIKPLFEVLAQAVTRETSRDRLRLITDHFLQNRRLALLVLSGAPGRILTHLLTELIEERLVAVSRGNRAAVVPIPLAALQAAHAQIALLDAWLRSPATCTPRAIADALYAGPNALTSALLR